MQVTVTLTEGTVAGARMPNGGKFTHPVPFAATLTYAAAAVPAAGRSVALFAASVNVPAAATMVHVASVTTTSVSGARTRDTNCHGSSHGDVVSLVTK